MALSDAVAAVQVKALALSGVKAAPANPPEAINQFPFSVCYPRTGRLTLQSAGWGIYLHTVICEIHVARLLLPQAVAQAAPYIELFAGALIADPKLNGTVVTVNELRYTFGWLEWADDRHIGVRFELDVKLHQT